MVLDVKDLYLHYKTLRGPVRAVEDVSFSLRKGEAVGIVGESGSGKTSMAIALMRLLPSNIARYEGQVHLDGQDLMKLSNEDFRREVRWRRIAMVFQGAMNALNPVIRVGFQVAEALIVRAGKTKAEAEEIARNLFEEVGLPQEFFNRYPHELSGGMKQRVVIAMALALNPDLVILDEPTSALDVSIQAQVMNLLKRLKGERDISMLFITHDISLSSDLADSLIVMYGGEVAEWGPSEKVLSSPKHPYTQLLLASTPRLRGETTPDFIPGAPPDLVNPPQGCRFHPRCPYVMEICRSGEVPMFRRDGQDTRCWLYR